MIKMVTNSNSPSSIVHAETRCRSVQRVDLPLDKQIVENQDCLRGPWAAGRGPRAVGRGPWAAGCWAAGPPGRRAAGRLGCGGPLGHGPAFSKTLYFVGITNPILP